jgi:branched-chain amino acid transport system ATP-binding protein
MSELVVDDMTVRYSGAIAVRNASLTAPGGSVTAILGANGAGKSSLVLGVYGSTPATGRVLVDGEDVSGDTARRRARRGLAIVPQGRQLFARLTVRENLQVMADLLGTPPGALDEALDRFPILRSRQRSLAGVLSGGEQQMLVVARALMTVPSVLLLDEIGTGLAPKIVEELADLIVDLARSGVAVVVAQPTIGTLLPVIDRGYVLVRGEVVATCEDGGGPLQDLYEAAFGLTAHVVDT